MVSNKVHWSFWVICTIGIIWNAMSCMNFLMQLSPEILSNYPKEARDLVESRPIWSTIAFALAVFGGLIGDIFLFLKRKLAFHIFLLAIIGVVVTNIHTLNVGSSPNILVGSAMSFVIGLFFIWYVTFCKNKSWLN